MENGLTSRLKLRFWGKRPEGAGGNWSVWLPNYGRWSHSMGDARSCAVMFGALNAKLNPALVRGLFHD